MGHTILDRLPATARTPAEVVRSRPGEGRAASVTIAVGQVNLNGRTQMLVKAPPAR